MENISGKQVSITRALIFCWREEVVSLIREHVRILKKTVTRRTDYHVRLIFRKIQP